MLATAAKPRPYSRRPRHTSAGIELPRIDCRTIEARRFRALLDSYSAEIGGQLSEADKALVQQLASVQFRLEQRRRGIVECTGDVDDDQIIRLSSEHRRLLGVFRSRAKAQEPGGQDALQAYLASTDFQVPADDAAHDVEDTEADDIADTQTEPTSVT